MEDLERPLLQSSYHNCPGCKMQRKKDGRKGVPKLELFYLSVLVFCNGLPICLLFPFVYFMVRDLKIAKTDTDIGYYAGFIGSAFMVGRFLSSTGWGWFSDKYGRKPIFTIGTISIIIFNTMFGFSTKFWMAFISRLLLGFFNGMMGPIRAYASEVCREEHQALGLSMIGTIWGLALIIGPAIGGYLAQPSSKYPKLFPEGSLFDRFPYALPCIIVTTLALISLFAIIWLPIFSLWAVSPKIYGGLGYTTSDVGEVLSISGVALLVFQLFIFSPLANFFTPITLARGPAVLSLPLVAVYPLIARLHGKILWAILLSSSVLKYILTAVVTTGAFILLNNSVPSYERGTANGISMTGQSLFKAIGPACAGAIFSWSQKRSDAAFLPGTWMVFFLLNIPAFITVLTTFEPFLPKSLNKPPPESNNNEQVQKFERHSSSTF